MSGYKRQSDYLLARIGTITNTREIVRRTMEQTACNFYEITVAPWTTAVLYHEVRRGSQALGGNLRFVFPGTCTDERWVNRLLGSSEVRAEKPDVGKPMSDWHRPYDYELLRLMLSGDYNVLLDEGVTVTAEVKNLGDREAGHCHTAVYARIDLDTPLYRDESEAA